MFGWIRFLALIFRPCRDTAGLISESMDRPLTRPELAAIRFHTLYCNACRRYGAQIRILRQAIAAWRNRTWTQDLASRATLPPRRRQSILQVLRES
jgi:hypothetical protein